MTELFNKKTIERLCANIQISAKPGKAAKEWLELLKSDALRDEVKNYPNFELIILQDLLGYDLKKSLSHEEGNIEFPFKDDSGKFIIGFEVKGTSTKDLFAIQAGRKKEHESPVKQLWDYMGGKLDLEYGIVTNYKDFILLDKSKGYSKYHFFNFTEIERNENKLKEFIAIFSKESTIDKKFLEELYNKSVIEEREFTKEFYKLFHETRLMLIKEFQDNGASKEDSIHYGQLFLNRLMFVFFTEDTGKLESRLFERTLLQMLETKDILSEGSTFICDIITNLFSKLNSGSSSPIEIFGFNGGLFRQEIPRNIYFKDLQKKDYFKNEKQYPNLKHPKLNEAEQQLVNTYKDKLNPIISNLLIMASYDFKTEVNVNILGHIFEQSLTDLEELKEGEISKRKKEGVYYTPEYITDYICRNTIIPYLSKKDATTVEDLLNEYSSNISELEKKFKEIKILDPACGSGAFLIKAVDVLLEIQKGIQEIKQQKGIYTRTAQLKKKKFEGMISLTKWWEEDEAREIIENNIFGVDINEESVEITKLSLFLKIARKNKKLIDLSQNIKCGNSLIDDPSIDEKAFNWQKEFKEIFDNGGFDVIIGNPPYVSNWSLSESNREIVKFLDKQYSEITVGHWDVYIIFIYQALKLLKKNGLQSFILPSSFATEKYGKLIRKQIINQYSLKSILDFGKTPVFDDVARQYIIYVIESSQKDTKTEIFNFKDNVAVLSHNINQKNFLTFNNYTFRYDLSENDLKIKAKLEKNNPKIGNLFCINVGVVAHSNAISPKSFKKDDVIYDKDEGNFDKFINGEDLSRYSINWSGHYIDYKSKSKYFHRPKFPLLFESPKLIIRRITGENNSIIANFDDKKYYSNDNVIFMLPWSEEVLKFQKPEKKWSIDWDCKKISLKYVLGILNSKLMTYYFSKLLATGTLQGTYSGIYPEDLRQFPIVKKYSIKNLEIKVTEQIQLNSTLNTLKEKIFNRIKLSFKIEKTTKKIKNFYKLSFLDFQKEIQKYSTIKLSLKEQDEWEDYFNEYKKELLDLKENIDKTDKEIDGLVYELYGLTPEEVKIVEGTTNS
ncbi:MAG: hypothetical protein COV47_04480 [Candidatus Diapherotrites archaeon CG11_big_fil_rev_8_21_14_0_20_37_9]|nr:MAG: hypothetical protein COV47_04480 [Candidatus Diapherotrites archaeon CG11_big_fil_rev_8_21_14_0_20_37_9]